VNDLQGLFATHPQVTEANCLGLRPLHGARLHHGFIVAKWNRFGIVVNRNFFLGRATI
jgi:hypothetical protein